MVIPAAEFPSIRSAWVAPNARKISHNSAADALPPEVEDMKITLLSGVTPKADHLLISESVVQTPFLMMEVDELTTL
jgi:hypothetical protein